MFFTSFTNDKIQDFKTELHKAAVEYKSRNISFLLGDPMTSQGAFQVCSSTSSLHSFIQAILYEESLNVFPNKYQHIMYVPAKL